MRSVLASVVVEERHSALAVAVRGIVVRARGVTLQGSTCVISRVGRVDCSATDQPGNTIKARDLHQGNAQLCVEVFTCVQCVATGAELAQLSSPRSGDAALCAATNPTIVGLAILNVECSRFWVCWRCRVGIGEQRLRHGEYRQGKTAHLNRREDARNGVNRGPFVLNDVEAQGAVTIHIRVELHDLSALRLGAGCVPCL